MTTFTAYCRVSTDKQGQSGLGLEAQQAAINAFLKPGDILLQPPFIEVESGKKSERPQLQAAIALCRRTGATLLIAKLDRLARNVAFIANLMESGVSFIACDLPNVNRLTVHILAAVAEDEAERISQRTKAALQAAKERGKRLGGFRGVVPSGADRVRSAEALRVKAARAAHCILPIIHMIQAEGVTSLNAIAKELNLRDIKSPRGGTWTATSVRRVIARVKEA